MSDFYCDHGVYATNLGAAPTWGVPQEGDGSSKDAATASSVAEIKFNALPPDGKTLSIAGATLTAKTTVAAKNQFAIGASVAAMVTNIINLINTYGTGNNQCDAIPVGVTATGVTAPIGSLSNCVFARLKTATTDTIEIMWRIGSTRTNFATNASCTVAWGVNWNGTDATTDPTIVSNFAGGAGGCFGYLLNTVAIGTASSIPVYTYGLLHIVVPTVVAGNTLPGDYDRIWCRTASGKTLAVTTAVTIGQQSAAYGYTGHFVFDTNTKWTGDSGAGSVDLVLTVQSSGNNYWAPNGVLSGAGKHRSYTALMDGGFRMLTTGAGTSGNVALQLAFAAHVRFERVHFIEAAATASTSKLQIALASSYQCAAVFSNCTFDFLPSITTLKTPLITIGGGISAVLDFNGCTIRYNVSGAGDPGAIIQLSLLNAANAIRFTGCKFEGYAAKYRAITGTGSAANMHTEFLFDACSGLKMDTALAGLSTDGTIANTTKGDTFNILQFSSQDVGRSFRYENCAGVCDWNYETGGFPTFGAVQPDGTPWALRYVIFSNGAHNPMRPFFGPKMSQVYTPAAAAKTVTVHMLCPNAYAMDAFAVAVEVAYTDSTGVSRHETTYGKTAPSASGASWTGAGSYPSHTAKSIALTTAYAIKQNTDVSVWLAVYTPHTSGTLDLFVSPEAALS